MILRSIFREFLVFVALTTSAYSLNANNLIEQNDVFCAEIGGKQIIAAILPSNPTLQDLQTMEIVRIVSKPWFAELPLLFTYSTSNPLLYLLEKPHSQISISIFGPLFQSEGLIDVASRHIPKEINLLCKQISLCPLNMFTDSICWATGCVEYFKLKNQEPINFPSLTIILKSGVGIALVENGKVSAIEIPYIGCTFPALETLCLEQGQTFKRFDVHQALGNGFFDWKLKKRDFADSEMDQYLDLYNARFQTFVNELSIFIREHLAVDIQSIYVGGENSKFIQPFSRTCNTTQQNVILLNKSSLAEDNIIPEAIQLLGCVKLCQPNNIITETYPSYKEISEQLSAN